LRPAFAAPAAAKPTAAGEIHAIDAASLELVRPRSVGVEQVGL
jgi:hypothetical protein